MVNIRIGKNGSCDRGLPNAFAGMKLGRGLNLRSQVRRGS